MLVLLGGVALGGSIGIGTVVFALGIGPLVQIFLPRLSMRERPLGDSSVDRPDHVAVSRTDATGASVRSSSGQ